MATADEILKRESAGDILASSQRWLDDHPDAPLQARMCVGMVIAAAGDPRRRVTPSEVAAVVGCDEAEVLPALATLIGPSTRTDSRGSG